MPADSGPQTPIEPRATTMLDLVLGTVGIALACALPSGLTWFDIRYQPATQTFEFVASVLIWACCLGTVGLAFAVVGRHAVYQRAARPAEWLAIALAARYTSLAITEFHARHGTASILVAEMESGLQADIGPLGRLACAAVFFAIIVFYVGVLFRYAGLSPFLRSLLGAAVALVWYWGPCDIWARETISLMWDFTGEETLLGNILVPAFPVVLPPLVLAYWAIFSRGPRKSWTHTEIICLIWFVVMAALLYFHPSVQQHNETGWFFAGVLGFVIIVNVIAVPLGWCVAYLYRDLIENARTRVPGSES